MEVECEVVAGILVLEDPKSIKGHNDEWTKRKTIVAGVRVLWLVEREKLGSMEVGQLQKRQFELRSSLFHEGILDGQFLVLQQLQDESNPDFVSEILDHFFRDSRKLLDVLGRVLVRQPVDFKAADDHIHQLTGSSSSIGASRVKNACLAFRKCCVEHNIDGCIRCLQQVKYEFFFVEAMLKNLLVRERQILAAGGSIPLPGYY